MNWDVFGWAAFRLVHRVHDVRCVRNVESVIMEKGLSPLRRKDVETGRKLERDAIVAFLRDGFVRDWDQLWRDQLINAIEAGEHLK